MKLLILKLFESLRNWVRGYSCVYISTDSCLIEERTKAQTELALTIRDQTRF